MSGLGFAARAQCEMTAQETGLVCMFSLASASPELSLCFVWSHLLLHRWRWQSNLSDVLYKNPNTCQRRKIKIRHGRSSINPPSVTL